MGARHVADASVGDDELTVGIGGQWLRLWRATSD
jgi:hypothetical protein